MNQMELWSVQKKQQPLADVAVTADHADKGAGEGARKKKTRKKLRSTTNLVKVPILLSSTEKFPVEMREEVPSTTAATSEVQQKPKLASVMGSETEDEENQIKYLLGKIELMEQRKIAIMAKRMKINEKKSQADLQRAQQKQQQEQLPQPQQLQPQKKLPEQQLEPKEQQKQPQQQQQKMLQPQPQQQQQEQLPQPQQLKNQKKLPEQQLEPKQQQKQPQQQQQKMLQPQSQQQQEQLPQPQQLKTQKKLPEQQLEPKQQQKQPQQQQQKMLQPQSQQKSQQNQTQHQQQQQTTAKSKVPPINTYQIELKDTIELCKLAIGNNFYVKRLSEDRHVIYCNTMEQYKKVKYLLKETTTEFYSFTPKGEKPKNMLLKGIDPSTKPEELLKLLKEIKCSDLKFLGVKPFTTAEAKREKRKLPIFLVQLSPLSKLDSLRNIKVVDCQEVTWEKVKKSESIIQCGRCQRFGHLASNCEMQPRCVKCGKYHKTEECHLGKDVVTDMNQLACALCKNSGHTASYRGCPKFQDVKKLNLARRKKRLPAATKIQPQAVTPRTTTSQMAKVRRSTVKQHQPKGQIDKLQRQVQQQKGSTRFSDAF